MISWIKVDPTTFGGNTINNAFEGDGYTSGIWTGIQVDLSNATSTCFLYVPRVAPSIGRILTISAINNTNIVALGVTSLVSTEKIRYNGSEATSTSSETDKTSITMFSDGARWQVLWRDTGWS